MIRTYQSDFVKHAGQNNAVDISSVFDSIPAQLSRNIDGKSKRFIFKQVATGLRGFADIIGPLEWLIKAGLVYKSKIVNHCDFPLESFSKENLFKLYLFDTGILGAMLRIPYGVLFNQNYGIAKGYFAENLVLKLLLRSDFNVPYCWQQNKAEVEFLTVIKDNIIPIEVKSGKSLKAKSLQWFIKRYSPKFAIRMSDNKITFNAQTNILDLPMYLAEMLENLDYESLCHSRSTK